MVLKHLKRTWSVLGWKLFLIIFFFFLHWNKRSRTQTRTVIITSVVATIEFDARFLRQCRNPTTDVDMVTWCITRVMGFRRIIHGTNGFYHTSNIPVRNVPDLSVTLALRRDRENNRSWSENHWLFSRVISRIIIRRRTVSAIDCIADSETINKPDRQRDVYVIKRRSREKRGVVLNGDVCTTVLGGECARSSSLSVSSTVNAFWSAPTETGSLEILVQGLRDGFRDG